MPESPDALKAFVEWFKRQPGAAFSSKIQLTDLSRYGRGRGIVATEDIPADAALFVIPRRSVLSVENSEMSRKLPQILNELENELEGYVKDEESVDLNSCSDPWLELIIVLMYEIFQGNASRWKPYLDILPSNLDTLMFWSEEELGELRGSAILDKIGKDEAERTFREKLVPLITRYQDVFYPAGAEPLGDVNLIEHAHRMGSIIMAYAFDLEQEEDGESEEEDDGWVQDFGGLMSLGLVPMADMLNADAEFNAHLNHEENNLIMTALRPIKEGEEILNYYGPLPNSELLRRYGYTSPKHSRYDVVEIPWMLIRQAISRRFGDLVKLPNDEDIDDSFVLERESGAPDETGANNTAAIFTKFPEDLENQIAPLLAPALQIDVTGGEITGEEQRQLQQSFIQVMAEALKARLRQYPTTIVADEELLLSVKQGTKLRKAIDVRLGEKHLLQEVICFTDNALRESSLEDSGDSSEDAEEKPQKKQKIKH